ncbi:hypothetical protein F3168_02010 [Polymorphobacter fuscus]|uniref:Uncharacterized protein n=2 Tax=Sandarakinorhabdus fusca TaxID=1439888 RepID=A0A7C9GN89_9SPHN|nr:hypothetical protein F9290_02010 [Polymorphobacter fuscus]MQT16036.1 hypothetical protein [Polymorphobacter fuscus]
MIDDGIGGEHPEGLRAQALARWEDEGGAEPGADGHAEFSAPALSNAEIVQLRVRVIALENVIIALLADASEGQQAQIRDMAEFIAPRAGRAHHPLTTSAASHMLGLVHRAGHFRTDTPGGSQ